MVDRIGVHSLAYTAPPTTTPLKNRPYVLPALIEDASIFRVRLRATPEIEDVRTIGERTKLRDGQRLTVVVEDVHDVVVIRAR